ncbi:MAG: hypothetical protein Q9227_008869 [Pyrenula ochraceoflavens]
MSNVAQESVYPPPPEGYESLAQTSQPSLLPAPSPADYPQLQQPGTPVQNEATPQVRSVEQKTPQPRLRKACDSCSARKVKCDESGPPCRSCAALEIPCTFDRPSRRRGPPNKHAEAIKRQRVDYGFNNAQISATADAAQSLASLSTPSVLSAESICRIDVLQKLIDDYFTYIHPLVPLPHEPTFRAAFSNRQDRADKKFLALIAAMVAFLVSSFPRRPRQLFDAELLRQFPTAGALIDRCRMVWSESRGADFLEKPLSFTDALTSYLIGGTFSYMFDMQGLRLFFNQAIQIMEILDLRSVARGLPGKGNSHQFYSSEQAPAEIDYVQQELSRRLFWVIYVGYASIHQFGSLDDGINIPPQTPSNIYPPLPQEIDDVNIYPTRLVRQPDEVVSELAGFNINAKILSTCNNLTAWEFAFGASNLSDWEQQKAMILQALHDARKATEDIRAELVLSPEASLNQWSQNMNGQIDQSLHPRQIQYEIQKANIYASQLATRSYLSEKYWNMNEARRNAIAGTDPSDENVDTRLRSEDQDQLADSHEEFMAAEREEIFRDLALLLRSVSQVNMEPNGLSFCHKIRAIASTLVSVPRSRMGIPSLNQNAVESYLDGVVDILNKLERLGTGLIKGSAAVDGGVSRGGSGEVFSPDTIEEAALVSWASLKDYQERFIQENGFMGTL